MIIGMFRLLIFLPIFAASCKNRNVEIHLCDQIGEVATMGEVLKNASYFKEVQYMNFRKSGKDYTVFSAEIEGEPGLLLAENSIHLTSVPGE